MPFPVFSEKFNVRGNTSFFVFPLEIYPGVFYIDMYMLIRKQGRPPEFTREPVYARHASLAFNRRMHKILQDLCREIATELSGKLHAVILGGNYGRGEGGTRRVAEGHGRGVWSIGEAPAEDIDILIVSWMKFSGRHDAIRGILKKYEAIFSVPIDLLPIITPVRLMCIPKRFNWRRLIRNCSVIYGPPELAGKLNRRYRNSRDMDPKLAWSLLLDQGLRLLDVIAVEQDLLAREPGGCRLIHQGKFFREIAQAVLLAAGRHQDTIDLQLHEFIWLMEELAENNDSADGTDRVYPGLILLKGFLPKAVSLLRSPEQSELDFPETWMFHLELWMEAFQFISLRVENGVDPLLRIRLLRVRHTISRLYEARGNAGRVLKRRILAHIRLLNWLRTHVFFT